MSDPKNISPLLDGFKLGAPMCDHYGIVCHPAIKENSNKKYIVKIISVPANQAQLDALLLAGAYKDPADAMEYFRKKGEGILDEAAHLKVLSKLEGFLPYEGWQMEPITRHRLGYEIYLVGSYKRSLEKYMAKNAFTHLEAVNLSLDLCSALSVCRQSGYIYVDLKPSNIYVSEKKEYRIGDLGFLSLDALRYAPLPEQYYSPYTPPELLDPMTPMNLSADTYAVGMILYQLYNDGHLPFSGIAPEHPISAPLHADYELSEIIMKAINPDPAQRWMDPKDLGKAIASYMQRNSVNDIPITPFIPLDVEPEQIVPAEDKKAKRKKNKTAVKEAPVETAPIQNDPIQEECPTVEASEEELLQSDVTAAVKPLDLKADEVPQSPDPIADIAEAEPVEESVAVEATISEEHACETAAEDIPEAVIPEEASVSEQTDALPTELSDEVLKIINKADDLIAYQIPEEVIYHTEPEEDPFAFARDDSDDLPKSIEEDPLMEEEAVEPVSEKNKATKHYVDKSRGKKFRKFLGGLFGTVVTAAICVGGFWYYQNIYLLPLDGMTISGTQDQITVLVDSSADESGLQVHCSDSNGNRQTESVKGGKVTFQNLQPSTEYTIQVDISGFHKLTGKTTEVFKTESTTQILTFEGIAGSEAGSVVLEFTVEGGEPDFWNIYYSAEGEDQKRETITNHSTMISGLTVGKVYTFTLDGGKNFDLGGKTQLQYMASKLILAEKMTALSENGSDVTISWKSPGDVVVDHWNVRCYDGYGFEETVTVTDTQALFTGLDPANSYAVEVTASGMTQPARMDVTADPIIVTGFHADDTKQTKLNLTWDYTGEAPSDGWVLVYTVDGSGTEHVECKDASASVSPLLPGATYNFTLQTAEGRTVFNNNFTYTTEAAEIYSDNGMKIEDLTIDLLKTPSEENWTYESLQDASFTDTFAVGDSASVVIRSASTFYMPGYETKVLYVYRNSYGNVLTDLVSEETYYWKNIWQAGDPKIGELDLPELPSNPGDYVLQIYFNGKTVAELDFHITE